MPLAKQNWDAVAFGRWNPGILTPKGIVERLFVPAQPDAEVEVEFPEDAVGPCRVNSHGVAVSVTDDLLAVHPKKASYADLIRAMSVVRRAMENLPETPISGVAFTLRYAGESDPNLALLEQSLPHAWDDRFAAGGYEILNRSVSFSVKWGSGTILLTSGNKPELGFRATISFRQSGPRDEMLRWLSISPDGLRDQIVWLFRNVLQIDPEVAR